MSEEKVGQGEMLKNDVTIMDKDYRERVQEEEQEAVPRKVYISKEDVETFGYTARCPGCVSILRGTARQQHSEQCRKRLEKELAGTEKGAEGKKKGGRLRATEDGGG